jgi:protein tyrosine phosphatase (PTP) superfamily phosphohydrolase (DUF442 family)
MKPKDRWPVYAVCSVLLMFFLVFRAPSQEHAHAPGNAPPGGAPAQSLRLEHPPAGDYPHVHNLLRLTDSIYSGGEPDTEAAFAELAQLGVKTVVSVDGAQPNLAAAKKYGLRYVHIPIGYDGIPEEAGLALARTMRDAEGPFYFHCHHGKHRGPSAAAVACIAAGNANGEAALAVLREAGTGKEYAGLWRDVAAFQAPAADANLPELVESAKVDSIVTAMSKIDHGFDNLKACQAAGWKTPPDHPDLVATQEALIVREGLRETARTLSAGYDAQFVTWMTEAETLAADVETQLKANRLDAANASMTKLDQACKNCHAEHRN